MTGCRSGGDGIFHSCKGTDIGSKEYCAAVVASHVSGSENLCQNIEARLQCEFSCCVYYYATDEPTPQLPEPLDPDDCKNLEDFLPYKTCFNNYLNDECDQNCLLTCCVLKAANVPVNPGCYDKDDNGKQQFCLTNCKCETDCETEECMNKCPFTCCVIHSDTAVVTQATGKVGTD